MKKFLAIAALAGVMVACNNSGDKTETTTDSTTLTDTTHMNMNTDTTSKMMTDTSKMSMDTMPKK